MDFTLKPFQQRFVYSQARHPAFCAGWGVGKTLCGIARAMLYSKGIPDNLGIIFRKTYLSLRDSTIKDFTRYTGLAPNSNRDVALPNGSVIMFRHIDELTSINQQNINLGWYYIEQAEELESDREFYMLFGRLRRKLAPSEEFTRLGLAERSGWIIANAGEGWVKDLWKDGKLAEASVGFAGPFSDLTEATTFDNTDNLAPDFLASLRVLERTSPPIYQQYVLNDWTVSPAQHVFFTQALLDTLKLRPQYDRPAHRLLSCDPATGGDRCVLFVWDDGKVTEEVILHTNDSMKVAGEAFVLMQKHGLEHCAVDAIGIGKGIADRLHEMGKTVNAIQSAAQASDAEKFANLKAEMWWYAMEQAQARELEYPTDETTRKELCSVRYKVVNSNGKIQVEPKDETKKRLGRSPDKADAWVYGVWGARDVPAGEPAGRAPMNFDHLAGAGRGGW